LRLISAEIGARVCSVALVESKPARPDGPGLNTVIPRAARLDTTYVKRTKADVVLQLSRAGVKLALVLNRALGGETVPVG
jgi:hypothetical protein